MRFALAHIRLALSLTLPLVAVGVSCHASDEPTTRAVSGDPALSAGNAPTTAHDSALTTAALSALVSWLDASMERTGRASVYGASSCDDDAAAFPSPLLATYEVLPSSLRGDTVVGRASVTTVGEQDIDRRAGDGFVARQRVRTDVLEWDVIPSEGGWRVCNGIRFGYRGADSLTRWTPDGAGIKSARALADSLRAVRHDSELRRRP
ncbi:MAG: hypothetical protein ABIW79_07675 [Gemmatimonas sp.]